MCSTHIHSFHLLRVSVPYLKSNYFIFFYIPNTHQMSCIVFDYDKLQQSSCLRLVIFLCFGLIFRNPSGLIAVGFRSPVCEVTPDWGVGAVWGRFLLSLLGCDDAPFCEGLKEEGNRSTSPLFWNCACPAHSLLAWCIPHKPVFWNKLPRN